MITLLEGSRSKLYNCPGGHCTIGIGHLVHRGRVNPADPRERPFRKTDGSLRSLGDEEVEKLLINDIQNRVLPYITKYYPEFEDLRDYQQQALVSFVFNIGPNNFKNSTVLKRIRTGDFEGVPDGFRMWNKSGGRVLRGLKIRREMESDLWNNELKEHSYYYDSVE